MIADIVLVLGFLVFAVTFTAMVILTGRRVPPSQYGYSRDQEGLIWDLDDHDMPEEFIANDGCSGDPFREETYVVVYNRNGEQLLGQTSRQVNWYHGHYIYPRDDVLGYREMTKEEIAEHDAFLAEHEAENVNAG